MKRRCLVALTLLAARPASRAQTNVVTLANQVRDAERAFAKTMADRDHTAFVSCPPCDCR